MLYFSCIKIYGKENALAVSNSIFLEFTVKIWYEIFLLSTIPFPCFKTSLDVKTKLYMYIQWIVFYLRVKVIYKSKKSMLFQEWMQRIS